MGWEMTLQISLLIGGALLGIWASNIITIFTTARVERIRIKSKLVEKNIDNISLIYELSSMMQVMTIEDGRTIDDITLDYSCDKEDRYPISIPSVLTEGFRQSDWELNLITAMDKFSKLTNKDIIHYSHFIKEYLLNVKLEMQKITDNNKWQFAFLLKPDFRMIGSEYKDLLDDFLQNDVYKLKSQHKQWDLKKLDKYREKLNNTNLMKYRNEYKKLRIKSI